MDIDAPPSFDTVPWEHVSDANGATAPDLPLGPITVRGDYVLGFETRLFRPCGLDELWWFVLDRFENGGTIPGGDQVTSAAVSACPPGRDACGLTHVYLEGQALVSERGHFGHLSKYDRTVDFVRVDKSSPEAPSDCTLASRWP